MIEAIIQNLKSNVFDASENLEAFVQARGVAFPCCRRSAVLTPIARSSQRLRAAFKSIKAMKRS